MNQRIQFCVVEIDKITSCFFFQPNISTIFPVETKYPIAPRNKQKEFVEFLENASNQSKEKNDA